MFLRKPALKIYLEGYILKGISYNLAYFYHGKFYFFLLLNNGKIKIKNNSKINHPIFHFLIVSMDQMP